MDLRSHMPHTATSGQMMGRERALRLQGKSPPRLLKQQLQGCKYSGGEIEEASVTSGSNF